MLFATIQPSDPLAVLSCPSINKGVCRHPNVDYKNGIFRKNVDIVTDIVVFGSIREILMKESSLFFEAFVRGGTLTGDKKWLRH